LVARQSESHGARDEERVTRVTRTKQCPGTDGREALAKGGPSATDVRRRFGRAVPTGKLGKYDRPYIGDTACVPLIGDIYMFVKTIRDAGHFCLESYVNQVVVARRLEQTPLVRNEFGTSDRNASFPSSRDVRLGPRIVKYTRNNNDSRPSSSFVAPPNVPRLFPLRRVCPIRHSPVNIVYRKRRNEITNKNRRPNGGGCHVCFRIKKSVYDERRTTPFETY